VTEPSVTPPVAETPCLHRWRIATPHGPTSPGVCRLCGAARDFPNYGEDRVWGSKPR
jgi:hypothetical protein